MGGASDVVDSPAEVGLRGGGAYPGQARLRRRWSAAERASRKAAARVRGPAGIKGWRSAGPAASLRPPGACLAGLTASGRSNLARRKISGLGPAGSVRLSAAMAKGRAPPASARSTRRRRRPMQLAPSSSQDRAPPPAGPSVQSPRRYRLCCACIQSPRGPGHASDSRPMGGALGI